MRSLWVKEMTDLHGKDEKGRKSWLEIAFAVKRVKSQTCGEQTTKCRQKFLDVKNYFWCCKKNPEMFLATPLSFKIFLLILNLII